MKSRTTSSPMNPHADVLPLLLPVPPAALTAGDRSSLIDTRLSAVPFAPTFRPTAEEFSRPYVYIDKIRAEAQQYGICKIVPPAGWRPPCALDFAKTRFGTKHQRIDQLMDRGLRGSGAKNHANVTIKAASDSVGVKKLVGRPRKGVGQFTTGISTAGTSIAPAAGDTATSDSLSAPRLRDVDVNDSELFYSALASWLEYCGHPLPTTRAVRLSSTGNSIDLHALYTVVTMCGGIHRVASTLGWRDVLSSCGVPINQQRQGMHKPMKALWNDWLASFHQARTVQLKQAQRSKSEDLGESSSVSMSDDDGQPLSNRANRKRKSSADAPVIDIDAFEAAAAADNSDFLRRSKRERRPAAHIVEHAMNAATPSTYQRGTLNNQCVSCKQSEHHAQKLRCQLCDDTYHAFCLSPPLSSLPTTVSQWQCRECANEGEGNWGFGTGNVHTLASYRDQAHAFKQRYFNVTNHSDVSAAEVSSEFWRIVETADHSRPIGVEYGSDLDTKDIGSVFPTTGPYARDPWNMNILPRLPASVLNLLETEIEGISIPWLYVGMCFSAFCWHNEDHYSYSINYVSEGEPKQWYGISATNANLFEQSMTAHLPRLFHSSPDLLFHLITMLAPTTINDPEVVNAPRVPIHQILQHAGEIVLTFPQSYHAGFNHGFNVAESVNFGPVSWMPYGQQCLIRYRFFHRTPVWSTDEIVIKVAQTVIRAHSDRLAANNDEELDDVRDDEYDARDEAGGELPLWKRAAWLLLSLAYLCDREYKERFRLAAKGTVRMKPWTAGQPSVSLRVGQRVQANISGWRDGVIVGALGEGLYHVRQSSDGLVKLVDQKLVRPTASKEDSRSHEWDTWQNVGSGVVNDEHSIASTDSDSVSSDSDSISDSLKKSVMRMGRMSSMTSSPSPSPSQSPTASSPRCLVCQHFLYVSCVHCSCTVDKAACLSHSRELCDCADQSKYALFRFTLSELSTMCERVASILVAKPKVRGEYGQVLSYHSHHPVHSEEINAIMRESADILHRVDDHVSDTFVRIATSHGNGEKRSLREQCVSAMRDQQQFPLAKSNSLRWSSDDITRWHEEADEWLSLYSSLSLSSNSLVGSELDAILAQADCFVWGDHRSEKILDIYRQLQSYQSEINSLSLSVCSIVSAHSYLRSLASQLVKCCESFQHFNDAKLLNDFMRSSALPGCLTLDEAGKLLSRMVGLQSALTCQCAKIASRYQRQNADSSTIKDGSLPLPTNAKQSMAEHLALLTALIEDAKMLRDDKPLASARCIDLPVSFTPLLVTAFAHGVTPIICPQRASVFQRAKPKLLDVLQSHSAVRSMTDTPQITTRATVKAPSPASPITTLYAPTTSTIVGKSLSIAIAATAQPQATSSSDPTVTTCAQLVVAVSKSAVFDLYPLASILGEIEQSSLSKDTAGSVTRWVRSAIKCLLFKPSDPSNDPIIAAYNVSPLATLSSLIHMIQSIQPPSSSLTLRLMLHGVMAAVSERVKLCHCWLSHCQRLLATTSYTQRIQPTDIPSLQCTCAPILVAASNRRLPSLSFCTSDHALPAPAVGVPMTTARNQRYGLCCVEALLACPITALMPGHEVDLLKFSREFVVEWSTRVARLLNLDQPTSVPVTETSSPKDGSGTPLSYLHGLKAEGEQLPFISPTYAKFLDCFARILDYQKRLSRANARAQAAIDAQAAQMVHRAVLPQPQVVVKPEWRDLEHTLTALIAEGGQLNVHLDETRTARRNIKQIRVCSAS